MTKIYLILTSSLNKLGGAEIEVLNRLIDLKIHEKIDIILVETHDKQMPDLVEKTRELRQRIINENIQNIDLEWV